MSLLYRVEAGFVVAGLTLHRNEVVETAPIVRSWGAHPGMSLADAVAAMLRKRPRARVDRIVPWSSQLVPWNRGEGGPVHVRQEPFDVYIGRTGHGFDHRPEAGVFGNPIVRGATCSVCSRVHTLKGETLSCYEVWLRRRVEEDVEFRRQVGELYGLYLGCFCGGDRACHGHILHDVATELEGPREAVLADGGFDGILAVLRGMAEPPGGFDI